MNTPPPAGGHWIANARADGLRVLAALESWVIMPLGGRTPLLACPCCGTELTTAGQARLVADLVYPMVPR